MSSYWEVAKEALGFAGAGAMAYPWVRDFALRMQREGVIRLPIRGQFAEAQRHFSNVLSRRIDRPKLSDMLITIIGMLLLAASFAIGVTLAYLKPN
ncbi:MAG TPA: hypothetical protein VEU47_10145 [Candidatus Cybelea sp.]|nr:hypothetical protein [Candidatus Cybelea sp.]